MNVTVRSERTEDYFEIAEVNALAFTESTSLDEVKLIDCLRHRKQFDPALSLVAVLNKKIIGHVLFSQCASILNTQPNKAAILAPIAVHPSYQGMGIGARLIEEGHKRLKEKGIQFSVLLGHETYYPKFGYLTNMFGETKTVIKRSDIIDAPSIMERKVESKDLPLLLKLWDMNFKNTNLAIKPDLSIIDWLSCGKGIVSSVLLDNEMIIGYVRYQKGNLCDIKSLLLNENKDDQMKVIHHLSQQIINEENIKLPLDPHSDIIKNLPYPIAIEDNIWDACMLCVIDESNQDLQAYCDSVRNDIQRPGIVTWPIEFDVC